jgi:hypothetical protein
VPGDPAGEWAVVRAPGRADRADLVEDREGLVRVRAAKEPVDADLQCGRYRAKLILRPFRHDLQEDLAAVRADRVGELAEARRGHADVLEADVAQLGVAQRSIDVQCVGHGLVVVGEHEDELDHRLPPGAVSDAGRTSATLPRT